MTDETRSRSLSIGNEQTLRKPLSVFRTNGRRGGANANRATRQGAQANASKRAAAARRAAFEEMFANSHRNFLAVARMILRNREDAEDAVQNAFLSGCLNLHSFEGRSALKTWFTRIVVNSALMLRRKRNRFAIQSQPANSTWPEDDWTDSLPAPEPNPEMILANQEIVDVVEAALKTVKPLLRQAFTLTYFDGLTTREGSAAQGVPCETFKARLFRAKRRVLNHTGRALASPMFKNALKVSRGQNINAGIRGAERNGHSAVAI